MSKLYAVTHKSNGRPATFGNCRKSSWTSPRWVAYHIGPRRWDRNNNNLLGRAAEYDVHTIDFETNTMTKISGVAFLSSVINPEKMKADVLSKVGIPVDIATLESLVRAKALNEQMHYTAVQYLQSKGINVNN